MAELDIEETLEQRAARLGITVAQLAERDWEGLQPEYPTENCILPSMFDGNPDLLAAIAHVLDCPMCTALVRVHSKKTE